MDRNDFRAQLAALDLAARPEEIEPRARMLALLDSTPACFHRHSFPAHFTGSALVVNADGSRLLLHRHRKLAKWLQFGGHCDGEPDLPAVAAREAHEESGIPGLILASRRPFGLDIHEIPAHSGEPAHFHYDIRFMFIAPEGAAPSPSEESDEVRWFAPGQLPALGLDPSLLRMIAKWQSIVARRRGGGGD